MNQTTHLVRQANQIAAFFSALPSREEALLNTAEHLRKFWAPSLRQALLDFMQEHPDASAGDVKMDALAREAVERHRDLLEPKTDPNRQK